MGSVLTFDTISRRSPESPDTAACNVMYNLDQMGNRTSVTDSVNGNTSYTPNNLNEYSAVAEEPRFPTVPNMRWISISASITLIATTNS